MKIYGHPASTCTRKVLMTLNETNTRFDLATVDFATGEHKKEPNLSRQPFGRIPSIDDDGFEMFESRAIARYINGKAQGKLVPSDDKGRAKMEQWISIETSEFSPNAMKFVYEHVFGRKQEPGVLEAAGKALETTVGIMEKDLAKSAYLAGADFTLADVMFMPYVEYAMATPAKEIFAKHPAFMAWWKKVSERPSWQKTVGKAS
jgi:glutathione S-transferase